MKKLGMVAAVAMLAQVVIASAEAGQTLSLSQLRENTHYHGLAVDPDDPSRLFLATHHGFFTVTPDGFATLISPVQDFMGFTPHPNDPNVLYASGHPSSGGNLGFIASTDGGKSWTQLSTGAGGTVDFHQMDVSPADPKVIYGVYGGLQVSRDGGRHWTAVGPVPEGMVDLAASPASVDRLYAATRIGLYRSDDAGKSWALAGFDGEIVSLVEPLADGTVLAFVVGQGLLSADGAKLATWTPLKTDFGERVLLHLAAAHHNPDLLYSTTTQNEIVMSNDGGRSWQPYAAP